MGAWRTLKRSVRSWSRGRGWSCSRGRFRCRSRDSGGGRYDENQQRLNLMLLVGGPHDMNNRPWSQQYSV